MIGAFWNIRGLNKEGRLQCITDFVKDNHLDLVGFQETKKESFQDSFLIMFIKAFAGTASLQLVLLVVSW